MIPAQIFLAVFMLAAVFSRPDNKLVGASATWAWAVVVAVATLVFAASVGLVQEVLQAARGCG